MLFTTDPFSPMTEDGQINEEYQQLSRIKIFDEEELEELQ